MQVALTTIDNPYDPFTQFDLWYSYDNVKGYHTCEYLARISNVSSDIPSDENDILLEMAIDEAVSINPLGLYKKVTAK